MLGSATASSCGNVCVTRGGKRAVEITDTEASNGFSRLDLNFWDAAQLPWGLACMLCACSNGKRDAFLNQTRHRPCQCLPSVDHPFLQHAFHMLQLCYMSHH